jgi:hypothetical protein
MIDELLEEARREQRQELEREAKTAIELRARLPQLVQETMAQLLEEVDDLEHAREVAGLDECERCGNRVDALRRLCPDCTRVVRDAREGPL